MGQPGELVGRAVHARAVGVAVRAVDVGRQRPCGRVDLRVLKFRRRRARHQVEEALVIAELRQRKVRDFLRTEDRTRIGLVGLQQRDLRLHGDRFAQLADFQPGVDAADRAGRDGHPLLHELLESLERHLHVVGAGQHVGKGVGAGFVRHRRQDQVGLAVRDGNGGAGNAAAGIVLDRANDAAVELLGRRAVRHDPQQCCPRSGRRGRPTELSQGHAKSLLSRVE